MPDIDPSTMTDEEIDEYAKEQIALSGDPDGDWEPLAMAIKNIQAFDAASRDPFWFDLMSQESQRLAEIDHAIPNSPKENNG